MKRQWALVAIGAWLAGTVCMSIVATENFYTIDRLLTDSRSAAFTSTVERLGHPLARDFLRYLSSELNRLYFQMWNVAQIGLAAAALWLVAGSEAQNAAQPRVGRMASAAAKAILTMLGIVVLMLVYLTPAIVSLGRELDFVPREPAPPGMSRFWVLHAAYTSLEMLKLAAGVVAAALIARRSG